MLCGASKSRSSTLHKMEGVERDIANCSVILRQVAYIVADEMLKAYGMMSPPSLSALTAASATQGATRNYRSISARSTRCQRIVTWASPRPTSVGLSHCTTSTWHPPEGDCEFANIFVAGRKIGCMRGIRMMERVMSIDCSRPSIDAGTGHFRRVRGSPAQPTPRQGAQVPAAPKTMSGVSVLPSSPRMASASLHVRSTVYPCHLPTGCRKRSDRRKSAYLLNRWTGCGRIGGHRVLVSRHAIAPSTRPDVNNTTARV
jgi:hypothetical protein